MSRTKLNHKIDFKCKLGAAIHKKIYLINGFHGDHYNKVLTRTPFTRWGSELQSSPLRPLFVGIGGGLKLGVLL